MLYFWKRAPLPPLPPCWKRQGGQLPPCPIGSGVPGRICISVPENFSETKFFFSIGSPGCLWQRVKLRHFQCKPYMAITTVVLPYNCDYILHLPNLAESCIPSNAKEFGTDNFLSRYRPTLAQQFAPLHTRFPFSSLLILICFLQLRTQRYIIQFT